MTSTTDIDSILIEDNRKILEAKREKLESFRDLLHRITKMADITKLSVHNLQLTLEAKNGVKFLIYLPAQTLSPESFKKFMRGFAKELEIGGESYKVGESN